MPSRGLGNFVGLVFALLVTSSAHAVPTDERRSFDVGVTAGFLYGLGGKARIGDWVGLETAGGVNLVAGTYNDLNRTGSLFSNESTWFVEETLRLSALPFVKIYGKEGRRASIRVGPCAQYDSLLSYGLGGGFLLDVRLAEHWSADVAWGTLVFPKAEQRLIDEGAVSTTPDFDFPPALQWGLNVGMAWLP